MPKALLPVRHIRIGLLVLVLLLAFAGGAAYDFAAGFAALPATTAINAALLRRLLLHAAVSGVHLVVTGSVFAVLNFYKLAVPDVVAQAVNRSPIGAAFVRNLLTILQDALPKPQPTLPTFQHAEILPPEETGGASEPGAEPAPETDGVEGTSDGDQDAEKHTSRAG